MYFMHLNLVTAQSTHTHLEIYSTGTWTFSTLWFMPLETVVFLKKKKTLLERKGKIEFIEFEGYIQHSVQIQFLKKEFKYTQPY